MARSKLAKMIEEQIEETPTVDFEGTVLSILDRLTELENKVHSLENPVKVKSINKVEMFNNEQPSTIESYNGIDMTEDDKIISMRNAIKILPPNMVVKGRHSKENVEAICGFKISEDMMDLAYIGIVHDEL